MSQLILIRGPICAGKSTTVSLLREKIGECSFIDQDVLKRGIDNQQASKWRDTIAFSTSLYLAEQLMKRKRVIIADIHSAIPEQYLAYQKLARKHKYKLYTFLLYPPLKTCLERNKRRVIPDVAYSISDAEIKKYWRQPYKVTGELMFNTSKVKASKIVAEILEIIGRGN